ncbi:hypothetical protein D3C85_1411470 [compost metagenome]
MDTAPGQFQVGNLAANLVGLHHHDHFTGDFSHDPAQPKQFIEGGCTANQIDAIGTDEQLIKVVRA